MVPVEAGKVTDGLNVYLLRQYFTDDDLSIFEGDIDRLATAGVTKGCNPPENDMSCPTKYMTRDQMAAFLHRALG